MTLLCIGAEQVKVFGGFSDNGRCTITGHEFKDRKSGDRERPVDFESDKDFFAAPPLNTLCGVARQV